MTEKMNDSEEEQEVEATDSDTANTDQGGFKLGGMNIPPELLSKVMQIDMSPENLKKLQKFLDVAFSVMPQTKDD
jgi:hypothetical protein